MPNSISESPLSVCGGRRLGVKLSHRVTARRSHGRNTAAPGIHRGDRQPLRVVPRQKSAMLRAVSRLTSGAATGNISVPCIVPMT